MEREKIDFTLYDPINKNSLRDKLGLIIDIGSAVAIYMAIFMLAVLTIKILFP